MKIFPDNKLRLVPEIGALFTMGIIALNPMFSNVSNPTHLNHFGYVSNVKSSEVNNGITATITPKDYICNGCAIDVFYIFEGFSHKITPTKVCLEKTDIETCYDVWSANISPLFPSGNSHAYSNEVSFKNSEVPIQTLDGILARLQLQNISL